MVVAGWKVHSRTAGYHRQLDEGASYWWPGRCLGATNNIILKPAVPSKYTSTNTTQQVQKYKHRSTCTLSSVLYATTSRLFHNRYHTFDWNCYLLQNHDFCQLAIDQNYSRLGWVPHYLPKSKFFGELLKDFFRQDALPLTQATLLKHGVLTHGIHFTSSANLFICYATSDSSSTQHLPSISH